MERSLTRVRPCESNAKVPNLDRNNTYRCSDKGEYRANPNYLRK